MGVKDLFKLTTMNPFMDKIPDMLNAKVHIIGIDMYVLLHKFAIDVNIAATLVTHPDIYLEEYYSRIKRFLMDLKDLGFDLYLVYDGNRMKYKIVEEDREKRRAQAKISGNIILKIIHLLRNNFYSFNIISRDFSLCSSLFSIFFNYFILHSIPIIY